MMVKGHLMLATAVFVSYKEIAFNGDWLFNYGLFIEYAAVMFGVLLPDIDHPKSTIGRKFFIISYSINKLFGHRKLTHSILFVFSLLFLSDYVDSEVIRYLAIGSALHLLGDYLTPSGIPLFYPFGGNYRAFVNVRTNGFGEHLLSMGSLALSAVFVYSY